MRKVLQSENVAICLQSRTTKTNIMIHLTDLELQVINALKNGDHFEDYPTESIGNLIDETGLTANVLRGVLSSLVQKELVQTGEFPNGMTAFHYVG